MQALAFKYVSVDTTKCKFHRGWNQFARFAVLNDDCQDNELDTVVCVWHQRRGGGYSVNFWVGMCHLGSEALISYQTILSCIVQPYSKLDTKNYYHIPESQSVNPYARLNSTNKFPNK